MRIRHAEVRASGILNFVQMLGLHGVIVEQGPGFGCTTRARR